MAQQENINRILSTDIIAGRDADFTKSRKAGRLNWESRLEGKPLSSFNARHGGTQEELMKESYRYASSMIVAMNLPQRPELKLSRDSFTDHRNIYVATEVFDDRALESGHQMDVFIGLAIHEGCHILYTDASQMSCCKNEVIASLCNVIEDERIEEECGIDKPGLTGFLGATKDYYFRAYRENLTSDGKAAVSGLHRSARLMNAIIADIRYPRALTKEEIEEFADQLCAVRDILTPYPESTYECRDAAQRIYDLLKKDFEDEQEKQQQEQQGQGQQNEQDNKEQEAGSQPQDNSSERQEKQSSENSSKNSDKQKGNNQQDNCQAKRSNAVKQKENAQTEAKLQESVRQIVQALRQTNPADKESGGKAQLLRDDRDAERVIRGTAERGRIKGTIFEKGHPDKDMYVSSYEKINRFIPAMSRVLIDHNTEYKFAINGMRSGKLNTSRLAEAYQGVQTVYTRQAEVSTDKIAVAMLIDESGSMYGPGEKAARDTAILINEALARVSNVDIYIYGHTARLKKANLFIYKEHGKGDRYALGGTESRSGNLDGVAIREVAARVRRFTDSKCLFFVISDGAPNEPTEAVRQAVTQVEKAGFEVVAISIDPEYDPSLMYNHNLNLGADLGRLPVELGKIIKQAIKANTNKNVRY